MGESVLLGSENLCDVVNGILNLHFPEYKLGSSAIELIPQPDMSDVKYSSFFEASDKKSLAIIEHILAEFGQNAIESYGWQKNDSPDNRGFTQYHPKGGKVTVKVYIGNSSGYGCIIEISDNGKGMTPGFLQEKIANRSINKPLTTKPQPEPPTEQGYLAVGAEAIPIKSSPVLRSPGGMGMMGCFNGCDKLGIRYEIESEINKGTTVMLYLPLKKQ